MAWSGVQLRRRAREVTYFARRLGIGLAVIQASVLLLAVAVVFGFTALFFYMSQLTTYTYPALFTGLISLATSLIIAVVGIQVIRAH